MAKHFKFNPLLPRIKHMLTTSYSVFHYSRSTCIFCLAFLLSNTSIIGQSEHATVWQEELSKAKGQNRVELIVKLTGGLAKTNLNIADSLAREGIALAEQMGDSLSVYRIGANLARVFSFRDEIEKGYEWAQKSLNYFDRDKDLAFDKATTQLILTNLHIKKKDYVNADSLITESESYFVRVDDKFWQGKVAYMRGLLYLDKKEYEKALNYFSEALPSGEQLENVELAAMAKTNIGAIKLRHGFYPEALELQFQVLSMECSSLTKAKCYINIGNIYIALEDWKPAMEYIKMAVELEKDLGLKNGVCDGLANIGIVYKKQFNFGEALKYFEQSLAIKRELNLYPGSLLGTLANTYNQLGQPDKANEYFEEYLELATAHNDWEGIWGIHYNRGHYFFHIQRFEDALELFLKSYEIAEEKKDLRLLQVNNEMLSKIYDELGDEIKASYHRGQYSIINDSINSLQRIKRIGALEQKHFSGLQKDSLNSIGQDDASLDEQDKGILGRLDSIVGAGVLILFIGILLLFAKKYLQKDIPPMENRPMSQSRIDQYFEELFARLDQNNLISESEKKHLPNADVVPINDMAEFLKDNLSEPNSWASFEHYFGKVHKDFFKNLKSTYPKISVNELNMCALLKLNLRNKDIAQIMGISPDSVRKAQNRLSKKLEILDDDTLRDFVLKL